MRWCGRRHEANRVEHGLYVCDECRTFANTDVNSVENIRQKVSPSLATDGGNRIDILPVVKGEDSTKWIFGLRVSSGFKYAFA
jgi:transposase